MGQCHSKNQDVPPVPVNGAGSVGIYFNLELLKRATNNFCIKDQIGEGVSAIVFRATENDEVFAVKRLIRAVDMNADYDREVGALSRLSHPNIIKMIGCCAKKTTRIVVYEFMPSGTLFANLHDRPGDRPGDEAPLDWTTRMKIAAGVAAGLSYLHNNAEHRVILRGLKSAGVPLGQGYHPKISDFGLSINVPFENQSFTAKISPTDIRMTFPYCAPEAFLHDTYSPESDVYNFGVLLLEIIIRILPRSAKFHHYVDEKVSVDENFAGLVDPELIGNFNEEEFMKAMKIASLCMRSSPIERPQMSDVLKWMNSLAGEPDAVWPEMFDPVIFSTPTFSHEKLDGGFRIWRLVFFCISILFLAYLVKVLKGVRRDEASPFHA